MLNTKIINHAEHGKCLYANNGIIEIGFPLDFGIRITHLSFVGEENVFFVHPLSMQNFTLESGWRLRGGHRLWVAPESPNNYYPDNQPIHYEIKGNTITLTQEKDELLNVVKSISLTLKSNKVEVNSKILNLGERKRLALWGLTVVKAGGVITVPLKEREDGYDPNLHISAWDYTDLSDERLKFSRKEIKIFQRKSSRRLKIGVGHPAGAITYENGDTIFKKHIPLFPNKNYADGGVSFEVFVSDYMAEIEGLSPIKNIAPMKTATYKETWELCRNNKEN